MKKLADVVLGSAACNDEDLALNRMFISLIEASEWGVDLGKVKPLALK